MTDTNTQGDFWSQFEGNVDGSAEQANVENVGFDSIPGGTHAPAVATELKLTDNQSAIDHANENGYEAPTYEKFFNVKWAIVGGDFDKRIIFQKIRPWKFDNKGNPDAKARTRQANMLRRLMLLTNCPANFAGAPTDSDLAPCLNKPVAIGIALWENKNERTGEWSNGNWISQLNPADANFEPVTGKQVAKHDGEVDDVDGTRTGAGASTAAQKDAPKW